MKRNIIFTLLFFVVGYYNLSANIKYRANYLLVLQDSIVAGKPQIDSLLTDTIPFHNKKVLPQTILPTTSATASTLLNEDGFVLDTSIVKLPKTYAWSIDTRYGDRMLVPMDTLRENFHRSTLVEGQGIAMSHLGNVGGPTQTKEFFARKSSSQFPFMDALETWRRSPDKQLYINTKIPYSSVHYQAGGGKQVAENHFKAELSSNFGKRLNIGFNFDYIYTRGYYTSLFNKQTSYDFNASYIGDRYKMHLFMGNNNLQMSDNGGITDDRYITSPELEDLENIRGNSLDIPVRFEKGLRNKYRGRHIFLTNSYDIGKDKELVQVNDTTSTWRRKKNYIAPASVILTTHYQDQRRKFFSPASVIGDFDPDLDSLNAIFVPNIVQRDLAGNPAVDINGNPIIGSLYSDPLNDYMSHYTFTNTLAFRMNEGFKKWTKFSLTAFIEYEMRRFLLPSSTARYVSVKESGDVYFFGAKLSKNQGKNIRFNANFIKGINTNDLEIDGDITTKFNLFGKELSVKANGYFKNNTSYFFQENLHTRNWVYNESFSDVKRFYVGGEIAFPKLSFSETSISGGYENISDYIYLGEEKIEDIVIPEGYNTHRRRMMQSSKNVNVFALKINQKLKTGIFHFDFQALLQKSTEEDIIPLPLWTAYANIYLKTKVSKVLTVQIGVDAYMHAKYYAPGYDSFFAQFYNQKEVKIGSFPHANAYINLHLKYTRFFIMAYNITEGMGNGQSFTTPHYPNDPFMVRWGLSWRFNN